MTAPFIELVAPVIGSVKIKSIDAYIYVPSNARAVTLPPPLTMGAESDPALFGLNLKYWTQ